MAQTAGEINEELQRLEQEFSQKKAAVVEPARRRLEEIRRQKEELDKEEDQLLELLGERSSSNGRRRRKGKRMTAMHKKEILGKFIQEGHIKDGSELTKQLRAALTDEGLGVNDFRQLSRYLPSGWEARSNGLRGSAARTTFHIA